MCVHAWPVCMGLPIGRRRFDVRTREDAYAGMDHGSPGARSDPHNQNCPSYKPPHLTLPPLKGLRTCVEVSLSKMIFHTSPST